MAQLAEAISFGLTDEEACACAGISTDSLNRWKEIPEFNEILFTAKAHRKLGRLKNIEQGAKNWQSNCWLLERSEPAKYGRPEVQLAINQTTNNLTLVASVELSRQRMLDPSFGAKVISLDEPKQLES
jgi:hypothetical protein